MWGPAAKPSSPSLISPLIRFVAAILRLAPDRSARGAGALNDRSGLPPASAVLFAHGRAYDVPITRIEETVHDDA